MSEQLTAVLISTGAAIGVAVLTLLSKWLISKMGRAGDRLIEKVAEPVLNKIIEKYIPDSIAYSNQVFVDSLRKLREWNPTTGDRALDELKYKANQDKAIDIAYDSLVNSVPKKWLDILKKVYPDIEKLLKTKIEASLRKSKSPAALRSTVPSPTAMPSFGVPAQSFSASQNGFPQVSNT